MVAIPVPAERIDLADRLFTLPDGDYRACRPGHRAIGVVAVERVSGMLLVQRNETARAGKGRVALVSESSDAFILNPVPAICRLTWDVRVSPSGTGSDFRCTFAVVLPPVPRALGLAVGVLSSLRRHVVEETRGLARDIARKFANRVEGGDVHDAGTGGERVGRDLRGLPSGARVRRAPTWGDAGPTRCPDRQARRSFGDGSFTLRAKTAADAALFHLPLRRRGCPDSAGIYP